MISVLLNNFEALKIHTKRGLKKRAHFQLLSTFAVFVAIFLSLSIPQPAKAQFDNVCLTGDSVDTRRDLQLKTTAAACYNALELASAATDPDGQCVKSFVDTFTAGTGQGKDDCNPSTNPLAKECRSRCRTCCYLPQFRCESDPIQQKFCEVNYDKCSGNSEEALLVRRLCPAWCGTCLELDNDELDLCRDTVPLEECAKLATADKCKNTKDLDLRGKCAFYCKEVHKDDTQCREAQKERKKLREAAEKDVADNCKELKARGLCWDPVYKDEMQRLCKETCSKCDCEGFQGGGEFGLCRDFDTTICKFWKENGFCWSPFYTLFERQRYCGPTCGICGETEASLEARMKRKRKATNIVEIL